MLNRGRVPLHGRYMAVTWPLHGRYMALPSLLQVLRKMLKGEGVLFQKSEEEKQADAKAAAAEKAAKLQDAMSQVSNGHVTVT